MKTYAIYLDNEECTDYGRIEAENISEAVEEAIERITQNADEKG